MPLPCLLLPKTLRVACFSVEVREYPILPFAFFYRISVLFSNTVGGTSVAGGLARSKKLLSGTDANFPQ
jgi:hypothetical protein